MAYVRAPDVLGSSRAGRSSSTRPSSTGRTAGPPLSRPDRHDSELRTPVSTARPIASSKPVRTPARILDPRALLALEPPHDLRTLLGRKKLRQRLLEQPILPGILPRPHQRRPRRCPLPADQVSFHPLNVATIDIAPARSPWSTRSVFTPGRIDSRVLLCIDSQSRAGPVRFAALSSTDLPRILAKAFTAVSSASGRLCRYFSVVEMLPCPSRSFTTWRSAPPARSQDRWAWRRPCILMSTSSLDWARAGLSTASRNQRRGMYPSVSHFRGWRGWSFPSLRRLARYSA